MRELCLVLIMGFLVVGCGGPEEKLSSETSEKDRLTQTTPPSRDFKTYLYKSGIITYELQGIPEGKETLYWDNWGMNTVRFMETWTSYAPGVIDTSIIIMDRDNTYTIDIGDKSGIVSRMRPKQVLDFSAGDSDMAEEEMRKHGIAGGFEVLPEEEILGFPCQVARIEVMGNINMQWIHKGIMLKMETIRKKSGKLFSSQIAVEFKPDTSVDISVFEIPEGIEMKTLAEVQAEAREALNNMHDSEDEGE